MNVHEGAQQGRPGGDGNGPKNGRHYIQSIEDCFSQVPGERGLSQEDVERWLSGLVPEISRLRDEYQSGANPILCIADETDDLLAAQTAFMKLTEDANTVIFLGTGGSSLGGQTFAQLGGWNIPGASKGGNQNRLRIRFYDNLDPRTLDMALDRLDLESTRFVITSKSGGTAETLCQTIALIGALKEAGLAPRISNTILGLTEPRIAGRKNGLRDILTSFDVPMIEHHTGIGGRFSCLTNVGLLPALAQELDATRIRTGAQSVLHDLLTCDGASNFAPAVGAAVAIALQVDHNLPISVMMPYNDRLSRFSAWYGQLWAESLGKKGFGSTPLAALGPVDQHSLLQLFMDGPRHHFYNFVRSDCAGTGNLIDPELAELGGVDYLAGKKVGDLVAAQQRAVPDALVRAGRPVRTIDVPVLNEEAIGALVMHFMIETILAASLLQINPFDQPSVEEGKKLARKILSSKG